jgi:hypothetical protein
VYNAGTVFVFEGGAVLLFSSALICDVYAVDEIINDSLLKKSYFYWRGSKTKPTQKPCCKL